MLRKPVKRPGRRYRPEPIDRARHAAEAVELFNRGHYWDAHESLESIWRALPDEGEARIVQGLIQAAAALLHRTRGNRHGVSVVGEAALDKLGGPQHPAIEFETVQFHRELDTALRHGGPAPVLRLRAE